MLPAREVRESILKVVHGEMSRKQLVDMALLWMLRRTQVPYETSMELMIADTIDTLLAMDEGPEYDLTCNGLIVLAERLQQR